MLADLPKAIAADIENFTGRTWLLSPLTKWLEQGNSRFFIFTGEPGTGKSALIAWLGGAGPLPLNPQDRLQLEKIRTLVKAAHFCMAASGTSAPKEFAQNIAEQLTRNISGFGNALLATLSDRVQISSEQRIGTVQSGANVTGIRIDLGSLGEELSFDRTLREPLKKLYQGGYDEPMLLLVDALDEAMAYTGTINIVQLLAKLADLPDQIRIAVTTRPVPHVLYLLHEYGPFDLIKNAPVDVDDVFVYAYKHLANLDSERRKKLADRISQAAEGIFLYAHLVLKDLMPRLFTVPDLTAMPLPVGLSGFYTESLNRELGGANRSRWFDSFKQVLGLIAVAQGNGLRRAQIERITKKEVQETLELSKQYLDGDLPQGPFRPFHKSFADFLLDDETNAAYHIDAGRTHKQIADYYWAIRDGGTPWKAWDNYGLQYTATHLVEAARGSDQQTERHEQVQRLVELTVDSDFRRIHKEEVKDPAALQRDLEQALRSVAADNDPRGIPLVVESALTLVAFRSEELRPEPLFDMARKGEIEAAARRLDLFDVESDWRQAALLTIAWLAAGSSPKVSAKLRDRIKGGLLPSDTTLTLFLARLDATLEGTTLPPLELPPAPSTETVRELIARMGAEGDNELLSTRGLSTSGYLAEQDGPLLVSFAAAYPLTGDRYFRQYLSTHTSYSYVQYRNRSLWFLLDAVLRHPNDRWVKAIVPELATAALAGSILEFREGLRLTILALQTAVQGPGALEELETFKNQALANVDQLQQDRWESDTWGTHKRQLITLAQVYSVILGRQTETTELLQRARNIPKGFAGFEAPALLTLAEALRICGASDIAISEVLTAALSSAHNIQDPTFCARTTARVNAMRQRWWEDANFDAKVVSRRLCEDSSAAEFAALHIIGEEYSYRSPGGMPQPKEMHKANTLSALVEIYHRPLTEFQRLNREQAWAADEPLANATPVNVPDPGFATLLAARFAAEVLADISLPQRQRVELIQSLVPIAAANPTVLDSVLTRLLLAARLADIQVLGALEDLRKRYITEETPRLDPPPLSRPEP